MTDVHGHNTQPARTRQDAVLAVRRQLARGDYDVSGRLSAALDRLVEDIVAESDPDKMTDTPKGGLSESRTRILVVDDHAIVRQGLARLVEAELDLTVCAEAESAVQAMEALEREQFELAIVDISLEDSNGLELTARMKSRCPSMAILILSTYDGLPYARRAFRAGAAGYVSKHEAPEKIIAAIHQVLGGKVYVSNSGAARAVSGAPSTAGADPDRSRSNRIRSLRPSRHGVPDKVQPRSGRLA